MDPLTSDQSLLDSKSSTHFSGDRLTDQELTTCRKLIFEILDRHAQLPYRFGDVRSYVIVDREENHFLLMDDGWENRKRMYGCVTHVEIRHGKIWIHRDGIEEGITDELVDAGIPKHKIILAFHPEYLRPHTGYGIN